MRHKTALIQIRVGQKKLPITGSVFVLDQDPEARFVTDKTGPEEPPRTGSKIVHT